jgi:hypothetical protein
MQPIRELPSVTERISFLVLPRLYFKERGFKPKLGAPVMRHNV